MPSSKRIAEIYSVFLALSSVCLGLINGIFGPTLLDLAEIYRIETNEASQVYTSRSVGVLIGAALESFAVNERNSEFFLIASLLVQGISIALFPVVNYFWLVHVASIFNGAASVFTECVSYVMLADLWEKPTLQLQIYQLAYAIATLIIPFACEPFLSQTESVVRGKLQNTAASRVLIPYAVVGACCASLGISMMMFSRYVSWPSKIRTKNDANNKPISSEEDHRKSRLNVFEIALVILMSVLLLFSFSAETTFTGMLSPFVVQSELHMDKSDGAFLGGVFRATFFAGRILTVVGYKLSLDSIMVVSLAFLMLSSAALAVFAMSSPLVVWLTTAGLGLGLSTLFGTSIAWTCQYIQLKHWHMAVTMLAVAAGTTSPTFLAAPWIDSRPMILPYVTVVLSAILCANFASMLFLVKDKRKMASE